MAPRKRTSDTYDSDGGFVEEDDVAPTSKRPKTKTTASKASAPIMTSSTSGIDDDGNRFWALNDKSTRRVTVNQFKGKWMVNIREMYEKDGKMLPGKKGMSLLLEQYEALIAAMPGIESLLAAKGQTISRPQYDASSDQSMPEPDSGDEEDASDSKDDVKQNFEATSEEEE